MSNPKEELETPQQLEYTHDDVFGEITEHGPNFRNVGFFGTVILMMKTQIGLGVLAIPSALDVLGLVPGIICMVVVACITTWSGYTIGTFKLSHREMYSIDDAGAIMFGLPGRVVLSSAFCLYYIFNSGSAILGLSIGLNAVSTHAACTAAFVAVAAILGFAFSSIRTLGRITWLAWIGLPCILTAVIVVTIAVGIQDRPAAAPKSDGPWTSDWKAFGNPDFASGIAAVSNLLFAFSGTPGFFSIVSEMRDPRHYGAAVLACQAGVTAVYLIIGCVIYYYCGSYVSSPALGSAGGVIKIISYAFALPGLLVTMTIVTHIPAKFIFVHVLRGSRHLTSNTLTHWLTWLACTFGITLVAWIIASTIPVFDALVSLIGALLGPLMCIQPMAAMWLYDNWGQRKEGKSVRWMAMVLWSLLLIVLGTFMMVAGTYGSVDAIMDSYAANGGSAAFSCADNSNSV
ncbi:transmembrane amino acid transporter protein-domain-containing protein [Aspergillus foveolatus]|uniref:transmembrane amino acid transporter protein-domain-containing protein n=1 Tax=Aspergillus foveolatus TaxID=210207 RepID=UPI003CCDAC3D